ncbi:hypothetical protein JYQ62_00915 [Nostoc sp. UHCC 0702]|nr:hypothetical protein JYQ62_00915 [Nostoc sp. UHCC 0702]
MTNEKEQLNKVMVQIKCVLAYLPALDVWRAYQRYNNLCLLGDVKRLTPSLQPE